MKKIFMWMLAASLSTPAMAQEKYELGKPNDNNYRYLDEYQALKNYIDYTKYPNFKLGIGTTVDDYLSNPLVKNMTNKNFTETVAGNAMKMSSCVNNNGDMDFTRVKNYVNAATEAGLHVYGHTLAWHSQQPNGWLRQLIADKPAPELTDGDVNIMTQIAARDFRTSSKQGIAWSSDKTKFGFSLNFSTTDGLNIHTTKVCPNSYDVQFLAMTDIPVTVGKTYKMTMTVKGSKAGKLHSKLGDWGNGEYPDIPFTTEWQDVVVNYKGIVASSFFMLQCGDFVGDIYIKTIKFEEEIKGKTVDEDRRCIKVHASARKNEAWDNQLWLVPGSYAAGASYVFTADVRADKPAYASTQLHNDPSNWVSSDAFGNINFTTEWKTVTASGRLSTAGKSIAFNLSELADENTYYFDNVSLKINGVEKIKNGDFEGTDVSSFKIKENSGSIVAPTIVDHLTYVFVPSPVPMSQQERHDALVGAMDKWIKGMMEACGGKVKAWDLVNEAISGGGDDGEGNYVLQGNNPNGNPDATWDVGGENFYWQDYMGALEYVRQACRLARQYGPEDIVLFINDYNLESDWDDNRKLKSLINWIKKWESDGVTKIDGIGTQMHISYYEDNATLESKKRHITKMFELMAATGKWVRVSEMDMGYVLPGQQNGIATSQMTEERHKRMAEFYEWIFKEYFRIVPPAQQWGICQWCPTDAPDINNMWRRNEPVGIWDLNYYRKHVYAGFVRGLNGGEPTGIDGIEADKAPDTSKTIYNLNGMRVAKPSKGINIIDGKKVVIND